MNRYTRALSAGCAILSAAALSSASLAEDAKPKPPSTADAQAEATAATSEAVTVWGIRSHQIGKAFTASQGQVAFPRFINRPLLRAGELAEVVPGLVATQHSGSGKANQYFLRGFNLDHGTDFSVSLDGMPLNLRTHAHGQGYLDLNFVIPETIRQIDYRKGPYSADVGDFSSAGSAAFKTFDLLPENFVQGEVGEDGWRRALAGKNFGDHGYVVLDFTADDGPWDLPEDLRKYNGFAHFRFGDFSISVGAYDASWNSTDQIPLRAVEDGQISYLGNIDPTDGGKTQRYFLNGAYDDNDGLTANVYVQHYKLALWSDFTYFLDDPVNGDQFEQQEERTIYGGTAVKSFGAIGDSAWTPRIGGEVRYDDIGKVGLYHTVQREKIGTTRQDQVNEYSGAIWGDITGEFDRLRVNIGIRADGIGVDVSSSNPLNSGNDSQFRVSPKASLAYRVTDELEAYASIGNGFHSNDGRGTTLSVDPATGEPVMPVELLVKSSGAEVGLRYETQGFSTSLSVWGLDLGSELVYSGDSGADDPSPPSRRYGVEALATWSPFEWLTLDGSYGYTDAFFTGVPDDEKSIPNAVKYVLTGGATLKFGEDWTTALTFRRFSRAPLIEDDSKESKPSTVINGRVAYAIGNVTLAVEVLNILDSKDNDITYDYVSRLPGEAEDGVDDIHFHPIPPRTARLQVRLSY